MRRLALVVAIALSGCAVHVTPDLLCKPTVDGFNYKEWRDAVGLEPGVDCIF